VVAKRDKGSYTLADQDGKILNKHWNSFHLNDTMYKFSIYSMKRISVVLISFHFKLCKSMLVENYSDSLYQIFTLTAKSYTKTLLKDGDHPDGSL